MFPLKTPQDSINHSNSPGLSEVTGTLGGFMNDRMIGRIVFPQLHEAHQNQAVYITIFASEWFAEQLLAEPFESVQPSQNTVSQMPA